MVKLSSFNKYLYDQLGQPYLWGGQHTRLTPDNYVAVITKMEKDATNRAIAIEYCKKQFQAGRTELFAYDCSGLGMYYLQNVTHEFPSDLNSNGMMGKCDVVDTARSGYWVFRTNESGRATHIGYMVSDTELIEAKGRAYGVVLTKYKPSAWNVIGKPRCIEFDDPKPEPDPDPKPTAWYVLVKGGSVRVRKGPGVLYRTIGIAHRGDRLPYLGTDEKTGWYNVDYNGQPAYITNKSKYTEVVPYGE